MWFFIKSIFGVVTLLVMAYAVFFVDLAGKPLAVHVEEIWSSQAVQGKVDLVRDSMRNELEDRLAVVAEEQARKAVRETLGPRTHQGEINPEDRKELEEIIARQQ